MQILCFRCEESVILGNLLVIKMHESWESTNAQRGVVNFTQLGKKVNIIMRKCSIQKNITKIRGKMLRLNMDIIIRLENDKSFPSTQHL